MEGFCAIIGDVISQNGSIKMEEVEALKEFFLQNHNNPVFSQFTTDELVEKVKVYAAARFMGDQEKILRAAAKIEGGSDYAKIVLVAALAVAYADGDCD